MPALSAAIASNADRWANSRPKGNHMLTCPFCNENDFDELGLEIHLANYCMGDQSPKLNSLAYREAAQQSEQRPKYRITLDNGDEIIYSDWSTAFQAWMDNGGALEFVR